MQYKYICMSCTNMAADRLALQKHALALAQARMARIAIADLGMVTQLSQQVLAVTVKRALTQTCAWIG